MAAKNPGNSRGKTSAQDAGTRQARADKLRKQQRRGEQRRAFAIWGGVAVVIVLIAGAVTYGLQAQTQEQEALAGDIAEFDELSGTHVTTPVIYDPSPPVGGVHNPVWLNCGIYPQPVQSENAVHSLEHGAVWVTYDPSLPAEDIETLEAAMPATYGILSPFEGEMPGPVVASSWGRQLVLDGADDPRLERYIREYAGSSDVPEPGALCTSGTDTGTPLSGEPTPG